MELLPSDLVYLASNIAWIGSNVESGNVVIFCAVLETGLEHVYLT